MRHAYKIMCNRLSIMICGFFCLATPLSLATEHTRSFIEYPGYSFWFNTAYYAYPTEVYIVSYTGTAETLEVPDRIHYTWDGYPTAPNVEADAIVLGERWGNYSDHYTHFQNTHIRNVTFPSAFTEFPPSMFYGSYNLRRVSASKVSVAGGSCFSCCSNLVSVVMPELSNISSSCFEDCISLTSVNFPNVHTIESKAFLNCVSLENVLADSVTNIQKEAFSGCVNLDYSFPNNLQRIGDRAFYGCKSLSKAIIPEGVEYIGTEAFSGSGILNAVIPDSITSINNRTFSSCSNLLEVSIGDSVSVINYHAFEDCISLGSITIPNFVEIIGDGAFSNCTNLQTVVFGDTVKSVGEGAFSKCSSLRHITLGKNMDLDFSAAYCVYTGGTKNPAFTVHAENQNWASYSGLLLNKNETTLMAVPYFYEEIHFPETVTGIAWGALHGCDRLTTVTIPENIIGIGTISNCQNLKTLNIHNGVSSFGGIQKCPKLEAVDLPGAMEVCGGQGGIIAECGNLRKINVGEGMKRLGLIAKDCPNLTTLTIPEGVTNFYSGVLIDCDNIKTIYFEGGVPEVATNIFVCSYYHVISRESGPGWESVKYEYLPYPNVVGYYPSKYKSEWLAALDDNGCWRGLKMQERIFTLSYNSNGAEGSVDSVAVSSDGQSVVVNDGSALHWEDRYFVGWALAPDGDVVYYPGSRISVDSDTTLYAVGSRLALLPISADWNSGSLTLLCKDSDSSGQHTYTLRYFDDTANAWKIIDDAQVEVVGNGQIHLTDPSFASRLGRIKPVQYSVIDETGQIATCQARNRHSISVGIGTYDPNYQSYLGTYGQGRLDETGKYVNVENASLFHRLAIGRGGVEAARAHLLTNSEASYTGVCDAFSSVSNSIKVGDVCLIYFATHGTVVSGTKTGGLYLYDKPNEIGADFYHEALLARHMKSLDPKAKGVAIVAVISACYSGALEYNLCTHHWCPQEELDEMQLAWITAADADSVAYGSYFSDFLLNYGWRSSWGNRSTTAGATTSLNDIAEYAKQMYKGLFADGWDGNEYINGTGEVQIRGDILKNISVGIGTKPVGAKPSKVNLEVSAGAYPDKIIVSGTSERAEKFVLFKRFRNDVSSNYSVSCPYSELSLPLDTGNEGRHSSVLDQLEFYAKAINGAGVSDQSNVMYGWRGANLNINNSELKSVVLNGETAIVIPDGVTKIGSQAFAGCSAMTSVKIPDSVKHIAWAAFMNCGELSEVNIGTGVERIDSWAFASCTNLVKVTIPASVTNIGYSAFANCANLTTIDVSEDNQNYTSVGNVLYDKNGLTLHTCPGGLSSVEIVRSVTNVKDYAFYGCGKLGAVSFSPQLQSLGSLSFYGCSSLTNVTFEGDAPSFSNYNNPAFLNINEECTAYVTKGSTGWNVTIPGRWQGLKIAYANPADNMVGVWLDDFQEAKDFADQYELPFIAVWWDGDTDGQGNRFNAICDTDYFRNWMATKEVVFWRGATGQNSHAFNWTRAGTLTAYPFVRVYWLENEIDVAASGGDFTDGTSNYNLVARNAVAWFEAQLNGEEFIREPYFEIEDGRLISVACNGARSIIVPNTVTGITSYAFEGCYDLDELTIPSSVSEIDGNAFYNCISLERLVIEGDGIGSIGVPLFAWYDDEEQIVRYGSPSLKELSVNSPWFYEQMFKNEYGDWVAEFPAVTNVVFGEAFTRIGNMGAFPALETVTLPDALECVEERAFFGCRSLREVTIPESVTYIGVGAFHNCTNLTRLAVLCEEPDNIGVPLFSWWDEGAECDRYGSPSLKELEVNSPWFYEQMFKNEYGDWVAEFPAVTNVALGAAFTRIGGMGAFPALETVTLPDALECVEERAFFGCRSLREVTIPESVTYIGVGAFHNCTNLTRLAVLCEEPDNIGVPLFSWWDEGAECDRYGSPSLKELEVNSPWLYNRMFCDADWNPTAEFPAVTNVVFGEAFISVGNMGAFPALEAVTLPSKLQYVEEGGFAGCGNLREILLPDSILQIYEYAFAGCTNLQRLVVSSDRHAHIGTPMFVWFDGNETRYGSPSLKELVVNDPWFYNMMFFDADSNPTAEFLAVTNAVFGWQFVETPDDYSVKFPNAVSATVNEAFPDSEDVSTEVVMSTLAKSRDAGLSNIVDVATYDEFRTWAIANKSGDDSQSLALAKVRTSRFAWSAFALDAPELLTMETPIHKDDIKIAKFDPHGEQGAFTMEVAIDDVMIGNAADGARLAKVFGIEGSTSLNENSFASENVTVETTEPVNGKVRLVAKPNEGIVSGDDSFFMRVRVRQ